MTAAVLMKDIPAPEMVSPSQSDLHRIMGDHQRYLTRQKGSRAKLQSAKLDGLMMAGRDLSEADMSGASLVGADLRGANLSRVSLYCADLRGADLRHARLELADLRGASFKGATLSHAVLDGADLRAATMLYLGDRMKFQGNAHDEQPFGAVDFSHASLRRASFRNAKLDHANFSEAILEGANFRGARLRNACFRGAVLSGVHIAELNASPYALRQAVTSPTREAVARAKTVLAELKAHHDWFTSLGRNGRPAHIEGEDLRPLGNGALKGLCLAGLAARNVIAVSVDFSGCHLQGARFEGADVRGATFAGADLSGASFVQAKVGHANFENARIRDLHLYSGQVLQFRAGTGVKGPGNDPRLDPFMAGMGRPQGHC